MLLSLNIIFLTRTFAEKYRTDSNYIVDATGPAHYAAAAYCFTSLASQWNCRNHCSAPETKGSVVVGNAQSLTLGVFGSVTFNPHKNVITAAFRGTLNVQNMISNTFAILVPLGMTNVPNSSGALVHSGFLANYMAVRSQIKTLLKKAIEQHPDYKIQFVGHSMGGTLSKLAALDAYYSLGKQRQIVEYSFNSPRLGNYALMNALKFPMHRFTQGPDIVSRLPPTAILFQHPNVAEHWEHNNIFYTCDKAESPDCSNSILTPYFSPLDHLKFGKIQFGPVC